MVSKEVGWGDNSKHWYSNYEYHVLNGGLIIKTFRTDVESLTNIIKNEAERFIRDKEKEFPNKAYKLEVKVCGN